MQPFAFHEMRIKGLWQITPFCADDVRGSFIKDYSEEIFQKNGITHELKEVFYTVSHRGVIRAFHFQREKQQPKLVRCISGAVYDVVVDLRGSSETFKEWMAFELTGENQNEILVPAGCAHGYLVLEPSIVSYKCAEKFFGEFDGGIRWDDKNINVEWPMERIGGRQNLILADKDKNLPTLNAFIAQYGAF